MCSLSPTKLPHSDATPVRLLTEVADAPADVPEGASINTAVQSPDEIFGHLIGRDGAWVLKICPAELKFVRAGGHPLATEKRRATADNSESVTFGFRELSGVGLIGDGGSAGCRYLCAFRYHRKPEGGGAGGKWGPRQRQLILFRLVRPTDPAEVALVGRLCARAIRAAGGVEREPSGGTSGAERPLLVLLNPHSGQGRAERLFRDKAAPLLREAGRSCHLVSTEFAGHATQLLRDSPSLLDDFSGLVIVSGDGLLYEALNGLAARPDWQRALRLPFAVLPAGGGNAMAAALAHANGDCLGRDLVTTAAFNLAKSRPRPVDLALVEAASGIQRIACLSVNYGLLAQVDLDSDRYRFMGVARFAFAFGLRLLMPQRPYRARLSYLPAGRATNAASVSVGEEADAGDLASLKRHLPASLSDPLPAGAGWVTLDEDFLLVLICLQSHLATDNFYVPPCRPDDGRMYITWVSASITKAALLRMFLRVEDGGHIETAGFHCEPALAFRLEPVTPGQVCIDGERTACESMQGELLPGLGMAMMPEPETVA